MVRCDTPVFVWVDGCMGSRSICHESPPAHRTKFGAMLRVTLEGSIGGPSMVVYTYTRPLAHQFPSYFKNKSAKRVHYRGPTVVSRWWQRWYRRDAELIWTVGGGEVGARIGRRWTPEVCTGVSAVGNSGSVTGLSLSLSLSLSHFLLGAVVL